MKSPETAKHATNAKRHAYEPPRRSATERRMHCGYGNVPRLGPWVSGILLGALMVVPLPAEAATTLGVDLNVQSPSSTDEMGNGGGFGLRFGQEYDVLILTLSPELSGQYAQFGGPDSTTALQFMGGGRLGLGFIIEPGVFAHAGAGHLDREVYGSGLGLAYDAGVTLDLTILPFMDIGLHAQLAGITEPDPEVPGLTWGAAGVHVEFEAD